MKRILISMLSVMVFMATTVTLLAQEESAASLYNDGVAKYKEKDYAGALDLFEQALEIADPSDENDAKVIDLAKTNGAVAAYRVATAKRKSKAYDEALAIYEKGIEWAPDSYSNYLGKAQALDGKGEEIEGLAAFLKAADVAEAGDKAEKAAQYVEKAERMMAKAAASEKWDDVMAMAESFGENRQSADFHNIMTRAYLAKGNTLEALKHAQKAVAVATEDQDKFQYYLGEAFEANGEKSKAAEAFKAVPQGKYFENAQYKAKELGGR